jgi:hypothetical protein
MKAGESQVSPARFTTAPAGHVSPVPQQIAFSFLCLFRDGFLSSVVAGVYHQHAQTHK